MSSTAAPIQFDEGWAIIEERGFVPLQECLDGGKDYRRKYSASEWIKLYTTVYSMCTQKIPMTYSEQLYQKVEKTLDSYLKSKALPAVSGLHDQFMLKELVRRWENHKIMVKWVKRIFDYIDRYYVKRAEKLPLQQVGYTCFKNTVFNHVRDDVVQAVLRIVESQRQGEEVNASLLKSVVDIFVEMGMDSLKVYTEELETPLVNMTAEVYRRLSAKWSEEDSFPEFMIKAENAITDEIARCNTYFHSQTEERLLRVCEYEILVTHELKMLEKENSGLVVLLEQNMREDIARMYRLYSRPNVVTGLTPVAKILRKHIEEKGMELINEFKNANDAKPMTLDKGRANSQNEIKVGSDDRPDFIQKLLLLHDRYLDLVTYCFGDSTVFHKAMKEAFEVFVNQKIGKSSTAELFANFCDSLLNTSGIGAKMSEDEIEDHLEKLVRIFTYLSDKDVFQEFARKQLSKRLLLERSHSDDAERNLISKLKLRCGTHFTSKLEGMVMDMNLSKDIQDGFRTWALKKNNAVEDYDGTSGPVRVEGLDFTVRVLTTSHWPTYQEDKITLPLELEKCVTLFKEYYDHRTSQRILRWVHSLSKGTVESSVFAGGKKKFSNVELYCNTIQICILQLFNDEDELTFAKIRDALGMQNDDLCRMYLISLAKKYPILVKEPKGKEIEETDVFRLNFKWEPVKRKITLPIPSAKISEEEKEETHAAVVEDRRHAIEAAIVRAMKQNKTMEHQLLIAEVSKLLMAVFKPEPKIIKNRIEELINREYLERDENNSSLYRYLA